MTARLSHLNDKGEARMVGYGGMLMEAFVAIMALIAAASLHPGVYFAMNSPGALVGTTFLNAGYKLSQKHIWEDNNTCSGDFSPSARRRRLLSTMPACGVAWWRRSSPNR